LPLSTVRRSSFLVYKYLMPQVRYLLPNPPDLWHHLGQLLRPQPQAAASRFRSRPRTPGTMHSIRSESREIIGPEGVARTVRALPIHGAERTRASSHGLGPASATDELYRPVYVVWELTQACDHACGHCGSRSGRALDDELSTREALDLVDQMAELGVKEVTLIGGEAYLHPGFLEVARAITQRGMHCSVTSGGRAIDDELAQAMASAGVVTVSVSMEGDEAAHDRIRRQKGSWARALRAIRALKRAGLRPSLNTQVNRWSLPSMGSLVELMIAEGVCRWMPIITVPMGRSADNLEMLWQPRAGRSDRAAGRARAPRA
jgi:sulfatase maturation enzyme AslB (radical SAM superfamily)